MASRKKDSSLEFLQAEFIQSMGDKSSQHREWNRILSQYNLATEVDAVERSDGTTSNIALPSTFQLDATVAMLNVTVRKMQALTSIENPEFVLEARNPGQDTIAEVLEYALAQVQQDVDWVPKLSTCMQSALLTGVGILKVGYGSEYVPGETAWAGNIPKSDKWNSNEKDLPYGPLTEYQDHTIKRKKPALIFVPTKDICFNLGVMRDEDISRIYHRRRRALRDVKHDSRYNAQARKDLSGDFLTEDDIIKFDSIHESEHDQVQFVYEIEVYDKATRQYAVFTENGEKFLRKWSPWPFDIDCPYHFYSPIPTFGTVWAIPYALLMLNQAEAVNFLRCKLIENIERDGKRIVIYDKNSMGDDDVSDCVESKDGFWVGMDGIYDENGRLKFEKVDFGGANPELQRLVAVYENDFSFLSGLTDAARNSTGGDQTATEFAGRQEQQGVTTSDMIFKFELHSEKVAESLLRIMLQEWDDKDMVKILGTDPRVYAWIPLERDRILKDFSLSIVVGSTQKMDKTTQRFQWNEVIDKVLQIIQMMQMEQQSGVPGPVDLQEFLRLTLNMYDPSYARKLFRVKDPAQIVSRLIQNYGIYPAELSPALEAQVRQAAIGVPAQQPQQPQGAPQGSPPPGNQQPNPQGGQIPQATVGFQSGRVFSEAQGVQ